MSALKKEDLFSEGASVRILTFDVVLSGGELFTMAMNIQKIKEILDPSEVIIQRLTPNYWPLIGLVNLRHLSVPLLDISHFLGGTHKKEGMLDLKGKRIIVCEFQKLHLGILVDSIHKIRQFSNSLIQAVPEVLSTFPGNVFNGVLEDNGHFIKMLDIEYVLTQLNVDIAPEKKSSSDIKFLSGKTILLVEDSKLFQKKLLHFFESKGANILLAENGEEGLEKLRADSGRVDLIFTDIEMPILNGIGMVREIKKNENWVKIPVVFNTSISNPGLVEDINAEGLGYYIVKFDEPHIIQVLSKIFKKQED